MHDRDEILARVDLEALADRLLGPRPGRSRLWPCPSPHHEQTGRTPPLSVFWSRGGIQLFKCHGCGESGTAFDLVILAGAAPDFAGAIDYVAGPVALPPPRRPTRPHHPTPPAGLPPQRRADLATYEQACVEYLHSPRGRGVRDWLTRDRAIPPSILDHAGVGADPGPRFLPRPAGIPKVSPAAVFPVRDAGGVVYTLSRAVAPRPGVSRWLNAAEVFVPNPRVAFYPAPPGSRSPHDLMITEGPIDALSALAAGMPAAALLGTGAADAEVATRLARTGRRIVLALDNDPAGRTATDRLATLLDTHDAQHRRLELPQWAGDLNDWHTACHRHWPEILSAALQLGADASVKTGRLSIP